MENVPTEHLFDLLFWSLLSNICLALKNINLEGFFVSKTFRNVVFCEK